MVKLDVSLLRYLDKDHFRVLTAVEMGMRNHELVPKTLVYSISSIQNNSVSKILLNLTQNKLLCYERGKRYDGYRLTYNGYDYLALNVLRNRGIISSIGNQIGVGKESDVYLASNEDGKTVVLKFHRLGRTCFRKVSDKRDYQKKGQNQKTVSWIYLSRLAAMREFAFMKLLHENKLLPIPEPIDVNRHCIVMELIDGIILNNINTNDIESKSEVEKLYNKLMEIMMKLTNEFGVVHGDFNEFNILIKQDGSYDPILIDFPQMISVKHQLANEYFERDVKCIVEFFLKRFHYESDFIPELEIDKVQTNQLQDLVDALDDIIKLTDGEKVDKSSTFFDEGKNELLSKFLNSVPQDDDYNDLYYNKTNENLVNEDDIKKLDEHLLGLNLVTSNQIQTEVPLDDDKTTEQVQQDTDDDIAIDGQTVCSNASTFTVNEIRNRLKKESKKEEKKKRFKINPKKIKADACAMRRQKKDGQKVADDHLKAYRDALL